MVWVKFRMRFNYNYNELNVNSNWVVLLYGVLMIMVMYVAVEFEAMKGRAIQKNITCNGKIIRIIGESNGDNESARIASQRRPTSAGKWSFWAMCLKYCNGLEHMMTTNWRGGILAAPSSNPIVKNPRYNVRGSRPRAASSLLNQEITL